MEFARSASRAAGECEIFGGAAEAHEQVVIVWINDRRSPHEIRKHRDPIFINPEFPRLGIVAARGKHRVS